MFISLSVILRCRGGWSTGGIILCGKTQITSRKTCPSATLSTNLVCIGLWWNPVPSCDTHSSNLQLTCRSSLTENAVNVHYKDQQVKCL